MQLVHGQSVVHDINKNRNERKGKRLYIGLVGVVCIFFTLSMLKPIQTVQLLNIYVGTYVRDLTSFLSQLHNLTSSIQPTNLFNPHFSSKFISFSSVVESVKLVKKLRHSYHSRISQWVL